LLALGAVEGAGVGGGLKESGAGLFLFGLLEDIWGRFGNRRQITVI